MAFNSVGQYTPSHKVWDHVGNILPKVEHSEGIRPSIEWKVAEWLPVQFFDKHFENWMVILTGKVLALDSDGRVVPAGLKIAVELSASGDVVTYTANDVAAGTVNVTTGLPVTTAQLTDNSNTTIGYTITEINAAGFMGRSGVTLTVSNPVGVAPYAYLQWAGGDGSNPTEFKQHNYNMQHQVAILCDYVLELPLVPAETDAESLTFVSQGSNVYVLSGVNVLDNLPAAANTVRTPIEFAGGSSATLFVNQVADADDIVAAGDWHINLDTGVISVYSAGAVTSVTVSYSHYAAAPATVSKFACAVGDLQPGDLVTFDADSNYRIANSSTLFLAETTYNATARAQIARSHGLVIGQVLDVEVYPRGGLDKVRTAHVPALGTSATGSKPAYLGQLDQMAGSATGGVPTNIHYAGAADRVVRINLTRF